MATGVGLHIGSDESVAAIVIPDPDWAPDASGAADEPSAEPVFIVRESVLHMSADGDSVLGGDPPAGYDNAISGFLDRVGDAGGIQVDDGDAFRAEDLVATSMFCLLNLATEHLNGPAEFYATHPASWSSESVAALKESLEYLGLKSLRLMPEPSSTEGSGKQAAHTAALAACLAVLATPAGNTPPDTTIPPDALAAPGTVTEEFPAVSAEAPTEPVSASNGPIVDALAYSAVLPQVQPAPDESATELITAGKQAPAASPLRGAAGAVARGRTPLLIAGAAAALLALGGGSIALALQNFETTSAPPVTNAQAPTATTTVSARSVAESPINFPTVTFVPPPPTAPPPPPRPTTRPAPPPPPPPPPPPSATTVVLPPEPTTSPEPAPTTTEPAETTTETTPPTATRTRTRPPRFTFPSIPELPEPGRPPGYRPGTVPVTGPWQDSPGRPPGYQPGAVPRAGGSGDR